MALYQLPIEISYSLSSSICVLAILLFGIPHGAIDHKIHLSASSDTSKSSYILRYILICIGFLVWWLMMPSKAFILFIVLSAYHFGQELLEDAGLNKSGRMTYLIWGNVIITAPIFMNYAEIEPQLLSVTRVGYPSLSVLTRNIITTIIFSGAMLNLVWLLWQNSISLKSFKALSIFLVYIMVSYSVLPFLVAFTLYFLVFHSTNAFSHQFDWLKKKHKNYTLTNFTKDLSVFGITSIAGLGILYFVFRPTNWDVIISYFFIAISLLTLPHALTFDIFYGARRRVKNSLGEKVVT